MSKSHQIIGQMVFTKNRSKLITLSLLLLSSMVFAQKKDENIGTEVVNVVKSYTPSVSDAFKVKEIPSLNDEDNSKKEEIKYVIFSYPVASTFVPSKGRAFGVEQTESEKTFKNYATLGFGNYGTLVGEFFLTENCNTTDYVAAMFRHHSSQGGIKEVVVDDKFATTSFDLTYGSHSQAMNWNLDLGYKNQMSNWYGLPMPVATDLAELLNPKQIYSTFDLGGKATFSNGFFNEVAVNYYRFWDSYESAENRFVIKPSFDFEINNSMLTTRFLVDHLSGGGISEVSNSNRNYNYTNFGIHPSYTLQKEDWTVNLGIAAIYSLDSETSNSQFKLYPKINASMKIVGDYMIFYAGAEGNLEQNSYRGFVNENPFISPNQMLVPTDRQFDIFAGFKGKLDTSVSYTIRGSYINEKNKALFKSNDYSELLTGSNFGYGNSLGIVYDNVKTIQFFGELKADLSSNFSFGVNGAFASFATDFAEEAWNLPAVKLSANLEVSLSEKWNVASNLFFVGQRKDIQVNTDILTFAPLIATTIPSYFDANLSLSYQHSNRLTGFLKLNNIANQNYQKWMNYSVQGFQVVLGGNYKFDF